MDSSACLLYVETKSLRKKKNQLLSKEVLSDVQREPRISTEICSLQSEQRRLLEQ